MSPRKASAAPRATQACVRDPQGRTGGRPAPLWIWGLPNTVCASSPRGPGFPEVAWREGRGGSRPASGSSSHRARGFEHPRTVRPWALLSPLCASVSPRGPWGELPELPLGRVERPPRLGERPRCRPPACLSTGGAGRQPHAGQHTGAPSPSVPGSHFCLFQPPALGAQPHLIIQPGRAAGALAAQISGGGGRRSADNQPESGAEDLRSQDPKDQPGHPPRGHAKDPSASGALLG